MISRRSAVFGLGAAALATCFGGAAQAQPRMPATLVERRLSLRHLHTGETLDIVYQRNGRYLPAARTALNRFLRDHRDNSVHTIDAGLFDFLHELKTELGIPGRIDIVCGYRSPRSNEILRARSSGVAKRTCRAWRSTSGCRVCGSRPSPRRRWTCGGAGSAAIPARTSCISTPGSSGPGAPDAPAGETGDRPAC